MIRVGQAVAVSHAAPGSDQWLNDRRAGVGGSEIAALLGLSQWQSPTGLWLEKTGQWDGSSAGEAAEWGHRLQRVLLDRWCEDHPDVGVATPDDGEVPSIVAHPDAPAARVSLDAVTITEDDDRWQAVDVIEIKTVGSRGAGDWADGALPRPYFAQVLYQLAVTGLPRAYVPVLIGGQRYESRLVKADKRFSDWVLEFVDGWWRRHVIQGRQPDPDPVADVPLLDLLQPPVPDSTVDIPDTLIARYTDAAAAAKRAEADLDAVKAELRTAIGPATHALAGDGRLVATLLPTKPRETVSVDRVRAVAPDLADQLITVGRPSRRLTWKPNKEDE